MLKFLMKIYKLDNIAHDITQTPIVLAITLDGAHLSQF